MSATSLRKTSKKGRSEREHAGDQAILKILEQTYPNPNSELNFSNEFQLIVSVILSAQCTDKKVNEVTPELFENFPDFETLAGAPLHRIEKIIRPVNYYRTKARNLQGMADQITKQHSGALPRSREALEELPGVGRKTASVVLSQLGIEAALAVDTHVFRVARRLGFASAEKRDLLEAELRARFPKELWFPLHHWLILHGRRICKAQRPLCAACPLSALCPSCML